MSFFIAFSMHTCSILGMKNCMVALSDPIFCILYQKGKSPPPTPPPPLKINYLHIIITTHRWCRMMCCTAKKVAVRRILICLRPISGNIPVAVSLGGENMLFLCGQSYKFLPYRSLPFNLQVRKTK